MADETVVLEEVITVTAQDIKEPSDADLANFSYTQYMQFVPEAAKEQAEKLLSEKAYGWKSTARMLKNIERWSIHVETLREELVEKLTGTRTRINTAQIKQNAVRELLSSLEDSALQMLCTQFSVSFTSFMASNDRSGLIETLVEEIERSKNSN